MSSTTLRSTIITPVGTAISATLVPRTLSRAQNEALDTLQDRRKSNPYWARDKRRGCRTPHGLVHALFQNSRQANANAPAQPAQKSALQVIGRIAALYQ
jgi:hypothetical protein